MPIVSAPQQFNVDDLYVDLRPTLDLPLYLKCEGFNFAGSVKLKAASEMVEAAAREGTLGSDTILLESSSGNLGLALAMIAANRGYRFTCVTDVRCNMATRQLMEAFGAQVHTITAPDPDDGFLGARLRLVRELCESDSRYLWLNQYANQNNWKAHQRTTAPAIARQFPNLDVLFVGAGTTGTLMGCARYFRRHRPSVTIVGVDSVGSVTFGTPSGKRMIPGLGTSVRPQLVDPSYVDDVVHVREADTVRTCHEMAAAGFLFGGSTGTVVSGAREWLARNRPGEDLAAVAIAPDLGERYLDTVYQQSWVSEVYGPGVIPGSDPVGGFGRLQVFDASL